MKTACFDRALNFRIKYRLVGEKPLLGTRIDSGEYHLITSNEIIPGTQSVEFTLENRLMTSLAYHFSKRQNLEAGII
jgi:hypothetical protein